MEPLLYNEWGRRGKSERVEERERLGKREGEGEVGE